MSAAPLLDDGDLTRLARLLSRLTSDYDGEVVNATRLANRLVRDRGLTWEQVLKGHKDIDEDLEHHRAIATWLLDHRNWLDDSELAFVSTIAHYRKSLTERQIGWLQAIHDRVTAEAA